MTSTNKYFIYEFNASPSVAYSLKEHLPIVFNHAYTVSIIGLDEHALSLATATVLKNLIKHFMIECKDL